MDIIGFHERTIYFISFSYHLFALRLPFSNQWIAIVIFSFWKKGQGYANKYGMKFTETSAKRGTNVEEIFFELGTVNYKHINIH